MQVQVRHRARVLCEYCHTAEQWQYVPFTVDHIMPLAQGGTTTLENLALACFHCNRRKAIQMTAKDPQSSAVVPLFNPRQHVWSDHFAWSADGLLLLGLTPIGRATIMALALNRERVVAIRAADIAVGRHPPAGDPLEHVSPSS
jgi:HNH endonuclease